VPAPSAVLSGIRRVMIASRVSTASTASRAWFLQV
jgi:hypothetical protein